MWVYTCNYVFSNQTPASRSSNFVYHSYACKPGTIGNESSMVKEHAKTTGRDIHPDYASILETGIKRGKGFFQSHYCTLIPGLSRTLLMKEPPSQGLMHHHWFPPQGATNNDLKLCIYIQWLLRSKFLWRTLRKTVEGIENSVLTLFRSVSNYFLELYYGAMKCH